MNIDIIIWLFPIAFMVHELEEIILYKWWLNKNKNYIESKFRGNGRELIGFLDEISTAQFALLSGVLFIIISFLCYIIEINSIPNLFSGMVITFLLIVSFHLVLSVVLLKYIPGTVTGFITGIYSIYALSYLMEQGMFVLLPASLWCIAFLLFIFLISIGFIKYRNKIKI